MQFSFVALAKLKFCKSLFIFTGFFLINSQIWAQDFGFGFDDEQTTFNTGKTPLVSISGEASASIVGYLNDYSELKFENIVLGDIFSGKLNFFAGVPIAEAYINLNIKPSESPVKIDEAYLRAFFWNCDVDAGLRKMTWGRADSFGPLDVINPLDYSQLTEFNDLLNFKIARPMLRIAYRFGSFSKIEGVFIPSFIPMKFREEDSPVTQINAAFNDQIDALKKFLGITEDIRIRINEPVTSTLDYLQIGARFTTTIGPADIGFQYYYGRLTKPAVTMIFDPPLLLTSGEPLLTPDGMPFPSSVKIAYNPYHQIGIDWAQVLYGFNVRAEFAANITEDIKGDDGSVYNPYLAWSFGFDRSLVWGINLNFQCNQSIRLLNSKVSGATDIEADTDATSTQIITSVYKTFFRDQIEVRTAVFWQIEAGDFMIVPAVIWTRDAVSVEISGGIFGGNEEGQFGRYKDISFIKGVLTFSF
ncbi:MAG: hypothetical protein FWC19_00120 [Treponema sp.]|nr:hypothetical protein [Treponema sp.]